MASEGEKILAKTLRKIKKEEQPNLSIWSVLLG
jgi:hypothetical protein